MCKETVVLQINHFIRRNILIMFLISSHSETALPVTLKETWSTWPRWFCVFYCQPVGRRAEGPRWLGALPTAVSRQSRPSSPGPSPPPGQGVWPHRDAGPLQPATPAQSPVGSQGKKKRQDRFSAKLCLNICPPVCSPSRQLRKKVYRFTHSFFLIWSHRIDLRLIDLQNLQMVDTDLIANKLRRKSTPARSGTVPVWGSEGAEGSRTAGDSRIW